MHNTKTLATLDTQDKERNQTKQWRRTKTNTHTQHNTANYM